MCVLLAMVHRPGPWFNIKMSSYKYRKSHCGDKTILRPSYLHNGISYTGKKTSLYWIVAQWVSWWLLYECVNYALSWWCHVMEMLFPHCWPFVRGTISHKGMLVKINILYQRNYYWNYQHLVGVREDELETVLKWLLYAHCGHGTILPQLLCVDDVLARE